jgi:hypothetical protein
LPRGLDFSGKICYTVSIKAERKRKWIKIIFAGTGET